MAELNDADKLKFIGDVSAMLKEAAIKTQLMAKNYDPTGRATVLDTGTASYNSLGGNIKAVEEQVKDLYKTQR